jgi:hypothetical protein
MYKPLNKKVISARTGKNTVALVGFSATTRDQAPWEDKDTEIWSLNESYNTDWLKRQDRCFQIHTEDNFNRDKNPNDPNHPQWLRTKRGMPIYMQQKYEYIPDAVKYPLDEIVAKYGNYQTSTLAFMLSLAMFEGFERIELYGFELGSQTEYHYQKAGAEYLIGMARGLGFEIYLPPECTICRGKMYGFESMDVVFRQKLEYRRNSIFAAHRQKEIEALQDGGSLVMAETCYNLDPSNEAIRALWEEANIKAHKSTGEGNFLKGQIKELDEIIAMYDDHLIRVGIGSPQNTKTHTQESIELATKKEQESNG